MSVRITKHQAPSTKHRPKGTVFVGMSGGVDSSVAAYLLQKQNYEVVGVFMRCYNIDGCAEKDAEDARRVAGHLSIPFYVWDFEEEYKRRVVDYMVEGYRRGDTPNPDVMCNREIKFGLFFDKARALGADFVATGHYVRKVVNVVSAGNVVAYKRSNERSDPTSEAIQHLFAARDPQKDQSYFLWTLTQKQLAHCLFPIGGYLKPEVRDIARKAGLPTAEKKDSQGICFLGEVSIADFLGGYLPAKRGAVVTPSGAEIGTHAGAHFYTIGQREGVFLNGARKNAPFDTAPLDEAQGKQDRKPLYVAAKDVATNTLVVAERDDQALAKKEVILTDVNWIGASYERRVTSGELRVFARVRYRQPLAKATLIYAEDGADKRKKDSRPSARKSASISVRFEEPVQFVAPGQSAVWYSKDGEMLGGGVIVASV